MVKVYYTVSNRELAPTQGHAGDAAYDLRAAKDCVVTDYGVSRIPTGLRIALPDHCFALVRLRSGFASAGFHLMSSGIIDPGYRGELFVPVSRVHEQEIVRQGTRFAQILILPLLQVSYEEVSNERWQTLEQTERGEGGFGSTGDR